MRTMEFLNYVRALHIFAVLAWAGGLIGLTFILRQHAKAAEGAHKDFVELEKATAMAMDLFAAVAISTGVIMIIKTPGLMSGNGWMHAKLTLIVVLLGMHGFQRARVGKYKRGDITPNPGWIIPAIEATVFAIVVLAAAKPF